MTEAPAGDEARADAVDRLLRERSGALLRTAYLLTGDHALAEDLLGRVLARTHARRRPLRDLHDAEAHAYRVMAAQYTAWWRRRWNLPADDLGPLALRDERDAVRHALAGLSRRERAAVVLRFQAGLSEPEAADALGISLITLKNTVSGAVTRLREAAGSLSSRPTVVHLDEPVAQRTPTS
ncbi:MAG TPA: sigma factor-like helix-turn-helix DNA-binding protein [Mycobacteriales bacterium]